MCVSNIPRVIIIVIPIDVMSADCFGTETFEYGDRFNTEEAVKRGK